MTPLEKVAKAIGESVTVDRGDMDGVPWVDGIEDAARAAIGALMEPSEEMVLAGALEMSAAAPDGEVQTAVIFGQPKDVFQAMIRTALEE